jgi:7-cyano-7-deazaguanine synthase in queuosine biosynthesis
MHTLKLEKFSSYRDTRPELIKAFDRLAKSIKEYIFNLRKAIRRYFIQRAKAELVDQLQGLMIAVLYEACREWRDESQMSFAKSQVEDQIKRKYKEVINRYVAKNAKNKVL